jgi:hypothetical protein
MKTTKAGLKRFFESRLNNEIGFTFKVVENYYDEYDNFLTSGGYEDDESFRKVEKVSSNSIKFSNGSSLYFDTDGMIIDSINDNQVIVTYTPIETILNNIRYNKKDYDTIKKVTKKYLIYKGGE